MRPAPPGGARRRRRAGPGRGGAALFARLAFVELPALGPTGIARAETALDALSAVLLAARLARGAVAAEADAGALWGLVECTLACRAPAR